MSLVRVVSSARRSAVSRYSGTATEMAGHRTPRPPSPTATPASPLPGHPRRRRRPPDHRRVDPPGQSRTRRSTRPRRHPDPPQPRPPAHRRRHPRPHHRLRQPTRRHPRRRARREGTHLRPARPQGHLQTRRIKNPGRSHHRPGELCRACGAMWGYGACPRGDLNTQAGDFSPDWGNHTARIAG